MVEATLWAQIWAITDIEPEVISKLFITPFNSLQEALNKAVEQKGKDADIMFLMDGSLTVPMVEL